VRGIDGKVVAITGASSGIGEATAVLLAERGARLVLGARRTDRLDALAARLEKEGADVVTVRTDVRRREDMDRLVAIARERYGRLDVLVNNAGIGPISPLDELRVQDWDDMIDVNVKGVLYGIAAALPVFREQGSGHVVTIGSTAGLKTVPHQAVYSATKFAVRAICEGLRQEAGGEIRVTVVSPGAVRTEFVDHISSAEARERVVAARDTFAIPPDAIARAIAYAVEQPADVDVNEVVVRPTAQV
jgi:NADP-dependent 3-hydroxy acid dehydrogenase YdfG